MALSKEQIEHKLDKEFTINNGYIRNGKIYIEVEKYKLINFIKEIYDNKMPKL